MAIIHQVDLEIGDYELSQYSSEDLWLWREIERLAIPISVIYEFLDKYFKEQIVKE